MNKKEFEKNNLPPISNRLTTVADMVPEGSKIADVGTDHGFVPIYLALSGRIEHAIAMDVRKGPLERATIHVEEYGLKDVIETRLSDGLEKLGQGEADTMICAGMGGPLMRRILESNPPRRFGLKTLILEPQSEIMNFRIFLRENGYEITDEDFLLEDGKYYPVIKAVVVDNSDKVMKDQHDSDSEEFEKVMKDQQDSDSEEFDKVMKDQYDSDIEALTNNLGTKAYISDLPISYKNAINEIKKRLKEKDIMITDSQLVRLCDRFGPCIILSQKADFKSFLVHGNEVCDTILSKIADAKKSHQGRFEQVSLEQADIQMALHLF